MQKNQFDVSGECAKKGSEAEELFKKVAIARGWTITPATKEQDRDEHWDMQIGKQDQLFKIDVKAMKKLSRADFEVQENWVWIELHGVRATDDGWLYGGKADFIAFEQKKSFIILRRAELITLLPKLVDLSGPITHSKNVEDAKYKLYRRLGRPDKLTLVEIEKLRAITWAEWEKV